MVSFLIYGKRERSNHYISITGLFHLENQAGEPNLGNGMENDEKLISGNKPDWERAGKITGILTMKIFLLRHATPNWSRKDIPYDIPPGPELIARGEVEAQALAVFLKLEGVTRLYHSPFERAARTAQIVAAANGIPCIEENRLAEWRGTDEHESQVRARMSSVFESVRQESTKLGPIGLVSHGGPIAALLLELGFPYDELAPYRKMFDTTNPLPPAGAWKVEKATEEDGWDFQLVFTPKMD